MKTLNYATIAHLNKELFRDMCHQFVDVRVKLKDNLKNYNDKLKVFLKLSLRNVPYMKNLSDEVIEEITYNLKQKYYEDSDVIYRAGSLVENLYIVTRGEVNLMMSIEGHSFQLHRLYQGCYIGSYKLFGDYYHVHTARAKNNVTIHALSKDSMTILRQSMPEFEYACQSAITYMNTTSDPIISFGNLRGELTPKQLLRLTITKILKINRDFREVGLENGLAKMLAKMHISSDSYETLNANTHRGSVSGNSNQRLSKPLSEALSPENMQIETLA